MLIQEIFTSLCVTLRSLRFSFVPLVFTLVSFVVKLLAFSRAHRKLY